MAGELLTQVDDLAKRMEQLEPEIKNMSKDIRWMQSHIQDLYSKVRP
jgi:chaperonin cofactor prefoldin